MDESKLTVQDRHCTWKASYLSRAQARKALKQRRGHVVSLRPLEVYRCRYCNGWHIGGRGPEGGK